MDNLNNYSIAFPARDAFYHGLSRDFYDEFIEFKSVFDMASDFMNYDLYKLAYVNPQIDPEFHTVCLITHCIALYRLLVSYINKPHAAIGFSQGEFAAVSAAGAVSFPEILKLVYELELLLINDTEIKMGAMVRVMDLDREVLRECCNYIDPKRQDIEISITYTQNQNVVSGKSDKIKILSKMAKQKGARWVIPLNGSMAFHSPLCLPILQKSNSIFDKYLFTDTEYAIFSCVDGLKVTCGNSIKEKLSRQIAMPVVWDTLIKNQKDYGGKCVLELGPGCTISGNSRIIDDSIIYKWINDINDFESLLQMSTLSNG